VILFTWSSNMLKYIFHCVWYWLTNIVVPYCMCGILLKNYWWIRRRIKLLFIIMNLLCIHRGFLVTRHYFVLFLFSLSVGGIVIGLYFFQNGYHNSLYQPVMMLSAFKDSILFQNLAALTLRLLMSYIYGAHILDVSRSHTTTQHSR